MTAADAVPLASALNGAGLRIFRAAARGENLAVSPVSIGLAFGMVDAGASGRVDDALGRLFAYPAEGEALLEGFRSLADALASEPGAGAENADGDVVDLPTVRIANSLWIEVTFDPEPAYVAAVREWFAAEAVTRDLQRDPEGSREAIDAWVASRTRELIPHVMPPELPDANTTTILVNTVYLKARWWSPFGPDSAYPGDFHRLDGTVATADLMGQGLEAAYAVTADYDAVVLPYVGDLEMVVIVPNEGRFDAVREGFDATALGSLDAALRPGHVHVRIPRFTTAATLDLREVIEGGLSIDGLFGTVGLEGIGPDLTIDAAVHATKVIVDEDGTEAAAATVVGIALTGLPLYAAEIVADRPFLYIIRDTATGAILFLGQYLDPAGD